MAKDEKGAKAAAARLSALETTMLRHAYGNIAYTIYPLPEGDKNALRAAVASLQERGLLSDTGREPQLTPQGREVCRELDKRGWPEAEAPADPDPKGGDGKGDGAQGGKPEKTAPTAGAKGAPEKPAA